MATEVARLVAVLEAQTRDFDMRMRAAEDGIRSLETATSRTQGRMQQFSGAIRAVGLAFLGLKAGEMVRHSVELAVAAEEAGSAFRTTFGPATDRVSRFVDEFANKAGFANFELEQMLAVSGNVVQGLGATEDQSADLSIRMATLAGDVASFSNAAGGAPAVLAALQSAINGEREALKTYGLAISEVEVQQLALNMTGKASVSELTRMDKALATVELAYQKANKSIGDLDRTQDSAANQLRQLNALWKEAQVEIGKALLPALNDLLPVIKDLVPEFGKMVAGFLQAIGPIVSVTGHLLGFVNAAGMAGPAMGAMLGFMVGGGTGALIGAFAGLAGEILNAKSVTEQFMDLVADESPYVQARFSELVEEMDRGVMGIIAFGMKAEDTIGALKDLEAALSEELTQAFADLVEESGGLSGALDRIEEHPWAEAMLGIMPQTWQGWQLLRGKVDDVQRRMDITAQTADDVVGAFDRQNRIAANLRDTFDGLADRIRDAQNAQRELADPVFAAVSALERQRDVLAQVEDGSLTGAQAMLEVAEAGMDVDAAMSALSPENYAAFINSVVEQTGMGREQVLTFMGELGLLDGMTVEAVLRLLGPSREALAHQWRRIWEFFNGRPIDVGIRPTFGGGGGNDDDRDPPPPDPLPPPANPFGGIMSSFHTGGTVPDLFGGGRDVPAILQPGEVVIPRGGSMGSVHATININGYGGDPQTLALKVRDELVRLQRRNVTSGIT